MTPRERLNRALNHQATARPPLDIGSTQNTSITKIAYENLRAYLGLRPADEYRVMSKGMQVVEIDEDVRSNLQIDTVPITPSVPESRSAPDSPEGTLTDEWGVVYRPVRKNGRIIYFELHRCPLAETATPAGLDKIDWPDPDDPGRVRGLREAAGKLRAETDYALVGHMGDTAIFQKATFLRGMEAILMDSVSEPRLFTRILERILEIQARKMENYLEAVGEYLDVVSIGDDLGTQNGPLISPEAFRRLIKPYLRDYFQVVKNKTKAKLHLHCCGSISLLLDDLIEIGVDVINPVQITARDMEPEGLKERFGDRLSFWGGIDTQRTLPCGSPEEVAKETRRIVEIMSRGGGYVVNPVHNIQWDVPPENIVAMCEATCGSGNV